MHVDTYKRKKPKQLNGIHDAMLAYRLHFSTGCQRKIDDSFDAFHLMTLHHFCQGKTIINALLLTLTRELGLKKNLLRHTILIQTLNSKHSMQNIHYKITAIASI